MMSEKWLNCKVTDGMFSDELAVTCHSLSGAETSVFVPSEKVVRGEATNEGRVKVEVFSDGSRTWAVLPNDSRDEILVGEKDISS